MIRPPVIVSILDGTTAYAFDAVIEVQYEKVLKVAEEAGDVKGKNHVNFAVTQPNKLQMEVSVSDTVTCLDEPLTKGGGVRSKTAYQKLTELQKKRSLLTVVTPFETFKKMLIETISVTQSSDYQNELHATVVFKEMTVVPKVEKKTPDKKEEDSTDVDESILFGAIGAVGFGKGNQESVVLPCKPQRKDITNKALELVK